MLYIDTLHVGMAVCHISSPLALYSIKEIIKDEKDYDKHRVVLKNSKGKTISVPPEEVYINQFEALDKRIELLKSDNSSMEAKIRCNQSEIKALEGVRFFVK